MGHPEDLLDRECQKEAVDLVKCQDQDDRTWRIPKIAVAGHKRGQFEIIVDGELSKGDISHSRM